MNGRKCHMSALQWDKLPHHVRDDLRNANFEAWYRDPGGNEITRRTLLNSYLKLKEAKLWDFVHGPATTPQHTKPGCLEFLTKEPRVFRGTLYARDEFSAPPLHDDRQQDWESWERTSSHQLHLKNHTNWPNNRIEAHVDPTGYPYRFDLLQGLKHGLDRDGYTDVYRISQGLKSQGFGLDLDW